MPSLDSVINALITLFVTIDPLGNMPLFLGLTAGMSAAVRRNIAIRGSGIALAILVLFALTGMAVLDAIGITIDAFRVAGGLLLFYTAFEMIYAKREERKAKTSSAVAEEHIADLAVFPLAIPLLAGPGAISATILLSSELTVAAGSRWTGTGVLVGLILALMLLSAATLIAAELPRLRSSSCGNTSASNRAICSSVWALPGASAHADFYEAWDPTIRDAMTENCIRGALDCGVRGLGDGRSLAILANVRGLPSAKPVDGKAETGLFPVHRKLGSGDDAYVCSLL